MEENLADYLHLSAALTCTIQAFSYNFSVFLVVLEIKMKKLCLIFILKLEAVPNDQHN